MTQTVITPPIRWFDNAETIPAGVLDWLSELGSMTRRFEQHCNEVTVKPYCEKYISREALTEEEQMHLPGSSRYWLREVVLYGDGVPWLTGRTVVPEETLAGEEQQLLKMGNVPLGRYLFTSGCLTRDYIRFGLSETHWARCSRLCLAGKPLLLTEVFLPASPAYPA
ncbi:chorismate lyase [Morganella morganii]